MPINPINGLGSSLFFSQNIEDINKNFLKAIEEGNTADIDFYFKQGADVNAKDNKYDQTALMIAAGFGHKDIVERLLAKGADVNAKDNNYGQTALMFTAQRGYKDIAELLLAKGADVNIQDKKGRNILFYAKKDHIRQILKPYFIEIGLEDSSLQELKENKLSEEL